MEALAAERVAVQFTGDPAPTREFELGDYRQDGEIVSSTGQLRWRPAEDGVLTGGYFTMNTPGTKAFVGFAPGEQIFDLGDGFKIKPEAGFAAIYLTAKNPDETLANAAEIVVVAVARARNTGMEFNEIGSVLKDPGEPPVLMEPVNAYVATPFDGELVVLDQDGHAAVNTRSYQKFFQINGSQDQTPFYLLKPRR